MTTGLRKLHNWDIYCLNSFTKHYWADVLNETEVDRLRSMNCRNEGCLQNSGEEVCMEETELNE